MLGNEKYLRFNVVLKLEFEVKISRLTQQTVDNHARAPAWVSTVVGVPKIFFSPSIPSLNRLKFH